MNRAMNKKPAKVESKSIRSTEQLIKILTNARSIELSNSKIGPVSSGPSFGGPTSSGLALSFPTTSGPAFSVLSNNQFKLCLNNLLPEWTKMRG